MRLRGVLIVATLWLLTSTTGAGASSLLPEPTAGAAQETEAGSDSSYVEVGKASWYGREFQGRRTANGERFDRRRMTAAHPTLPLDTVVKVTNLRNGKTIEVRVNDRGPHRKGRVIDLSAKAAEELGMKSRGVALVKIEVVDDGDDDNDG
jgi:rare lipoprotein A (peptidoglycan hydrolase)